MTKTWNRFRLAPATATFIIVISFHIIFFLDDPLQFLELEIVLRRDLVHLVEQFAQRFAVVPKVALP